jgi:UPF0271 protein
MAIAPGELVQILLYQIGALGAIAAAEAVNLQHVKPHGALYTMAVNEAAVGSAVIEAVGSVGLPLIALSGSRWAARAREAGLQVAAEAYIDRGYQADGTLVPRGRPGALISEPRLAAERAVRVVTEGIVAAVTGEQVAVHADTLCIHSDTPGAAAIAAAVHQALVTAGIRIAPLRDWSFERGGRAKA